MIQQIFVNLPVKDLTRSIAFFGALGFTFNRKFTDDNAACMILGENMFAMLLVESFFKGFTKKPISDAHQATEVIVALSVESRARVVELVSKAVEAGAATPVAAIDHGFMYQHGFEDLDGHQWELFHMDSDAQG